jgi:hypothetical protein
MQYIYDNVALGETLFDKLSHRLGMRMGQFVRNRMTMTTNIIHAQAKRFSSSPLYITNVACGMAWELDPIVRQNVLPENSIITLLDQEAKVLNFSSERIKLYLFQHGRQDVGLNAVQTSFTELCAVNAVFANLPPQHVIYSLGLTDYLTLKQVQIMVTSLYAKLAPGGKLILANVCESPHKLDWAVSYIFDWELIYRSEQDMRDMVANVPDAIVTVQPDATGHALLLTIERPTAEIHGSLEK